MAKRFIDTEKNRVAHRGIDPKLRLAFEWLWQNCDAAGVWKIDLALFKFECGYALNIQGLLKSCPSLKQLPGGALFLSDFVPVNYGTLKIGYNPHKPVFRSLEANGIDPSTLQFQDLGNPCPRVEEEGEGEEEDKEKGNPARKGPDPEVQAVVDHLTAALKVEGIAQSLDNSIKDNRFAARSLLDKLARDYPEFAALDSAKHLINAAMQDEFHRRNATNVRYLLNNCGKIAAASKARRAEGKNQTPQDRDQQLANVLQQRAAARTVNS